MSYTTKFIIGDDDHGYLTKCPCCGCGEYLMLDDYELNQYNNYGTVSIECYNCSTIFYLEK